MDADDDRPTRSAVPNVCIVARGEAGGGGLTYTSHYITAKRLQSADMEDGTKYSAVPAERHGGVAEDREASHSI